MKTQGLQSFQSVQNNSFLDQAMKQQESPSELSGEEQKMINNKFTSKSKPLEFYEGSGAVRKEQPAAKGSNIDFTV